MKSFLECYNYKFLNESSRVRSYNKSTPSCSDTALSGWYRFSGEAGNQMADSCVSRSHCGAMLPGWLSGGHPKVEEGVVQRKVCFTANSCCHSSIYTSVRNCGLFYVYKLTPLPACNLRYCGSEVLPPTTISPGRITRFVFLVTPHSCLKRSVKKYILYTYKISSPPV